MLAGSGRRRDASALRHLVIALGTVEEWIRSRRDDEASWQGRLTRLAETAGRHGVSRVSLVPFDGVSHTTPICSIRVRSAHPSIDECELIADCSMDGRERIVTAVGRLPRRRRISEKSLSTAVVGGAGEPDLVVVVGDGTRLPTNLVWELAYAEMVFVDTDFAGFGAGHIERAIVEFGNRNRRFGGVDE